MSHLHPNPVAALSTIGNPAADGEFIVATGAGTFAYESGATVRTSLGLAIGTDVQAWDAGLDDIAALAVTDGNIIVGDGANWVAESGATARTSLGLAIGTDVQAFDDLLQDIADIAGTFTAADQIIVSTGVGTAALESGATARTSLGLAIGTDVQAWDAQLDDIAALAVTDGNFIVGDGANWVAESGATARTSLGLGTGDSPQFTNLTLTGNLIVQGDPIQLQAEKLQVDDNAIMLNSNYVTASVQDFGIAGIVQGTGTTDTVSAWATATTITTVGSAIFSAGDYIALTACGVNDGVYRVLSHTGTTLTIATSGDDVPGVINTSLDTTEALTGTISGVELAGFRYDSSASTWEFATAASTGPLTYTTVDSGLLSANNTWTGTQTFQDEITTEAIKRQFVTVTGATYTVLASDHIIFVNNTAAGTTVNLPAATGTGRELVIKRADTSTQSVDVDGSGAETIDGDAVVGLSAGSSITIIDVASGVWAII